MGVAWVFEIEQGSNQPSAKEIERTLEAGGAETVGTYLVDCIPYTPREKMTSNVNYIMHHSNFPQSTFSIAPGDRTNFKEMARAICDKGFDLIIKNMSSGFEPDNAAKFTISGTEYRFNDFSVRVGSALQVSTFKGVVVEVEYEPLFVTTQALTMLNDFMKHFFSKHMNSKPDVLEDKPKPETYSPMDTMYQYLKIFNAMRKRAN
ncbi:hypothetical protein WR25_22123 [Diploscapter pachys]|uniref:Mediator of RNA polymerase II transcription subunit 20 n=1 Tax=Diploscapter pachys TaxID=2018661 RepID=A0A2A2M145_9BILA|nr:hypothetical protein WR25_22123 [Diploscapter pachys]